MDIAWSEYSCALRDSLTEDQMKSWHGERKGSDGPVRSGLSGAGAENPGVERVWGTEGVRGVTLDWRTAMGGTEAEGG